MEVIVIGLTCHLCSLYGDRTKDFDTERGIFMHLLRHRDSGHAVPKHLIDKYDPDFDAARLPKSNVDRLTVVPEHTGPVRGRVR